MSINLHSMLITPHIDKGYLNKLASIVDFYRADYVMYRSTSAEYINQFCNTLENSNTKILLNFPFSDIQQAIELTHSFHGLHLKSDRFSLIAPLSKTLKSKLIGYSAHSVDEAISAIESGATYCTLSPIFPTPNKNSPLGLATLESIPSHYRARIVALGGITPKHIIDLENLGLFGFAGIRYFSYNYSSLPNS